MDGPAKQISPSAISDLSHRANNFDFLRFALAVAVILSHSFDLLNLKSKNPFYLFSGGQTEGGSLAVDGFFIISGYLIAQSFLNSRGVGSYFLKRCLRIYPAFIVAGILSLCVFGPIGMAFSAEYWHSIQPGTFLARLPGLQTYWIPQAFKHNHWPYVNTAVWTIQYEFLCYILIAAIGIVGLLKNRWAVLTLFIGAYVWHLASVYADFWVYDWKDLPVGGQPDYYPRFLTFFLAGTVCLAFRDRLRFDWLTALVAAIFTAIACVYHYDRLDLLDATLPVTMPFIIFAAAFSKRIKLYNWGKYGDFSYGLYVFAWPVQQILIHWTGGAIHPLVLFVAAFAITSVFAVGSWFWVERPFLRLKPKKKSPKPEAPSTQSPTPSPVATAAGADGIAELADAKSIA